MKYIVRIEENSHYDDDRARWTLGEFEDSDVALAAARRVIDEDLQSLHRPGMTADELYHHYTSFGHDAYIISDDAGCRFSGWDYACQRCNEIWGRPLPQDRS